MATLSQKINFIQKWFGQIHKSSDERNISVCCPFCDTYVLSKKKLTFRSEDGANHCWVCDWRSRTPHRAVLAAGLGPKAMQECNEVYGAVDATRLRTPIPAPDLSKVELPRGFTLFTKDSIRSQNAQYLFERLIAPKEEGGRGLTYSQVKRYRLGFTDVEGEYCGRVIFPSFDAEGKLNYYTARGFSGQFPKYINIKKEKNSIVFNEMDVDFSKDVLLVEGPFDLTSCTTLNAVPMLGSQLHEESLLFQRICEGSDSVTLMFDPDAVKKRARVASAFQMYGISVRVVDLPDGKDPCDLGEAAVKNLYLNGASAYDLKSRLGSIPNPKLL